METKLPFALITLCAASALARQNDWLIVPGKRLGPVNSDTTRADLDRLFGKADVQDQPVDREGPERATVVFPKMPAAALAIFWQDDNRIDRVMVCYQSEAGPCKWHTASGVGLGKAESCLQRSGYAPASSHGNPDGSGLPGKD